MLLMLLKTSLKARWLISKNNPEIFWFKEKANDSLLIMVITETYVTAINKTIIECSSGMYPA